MDKNASTVPVSVLGSRPVTFSPVTMTARSAPATAEEEDIDGESLEKKRERLRRYDAKGKSIKPSGTPEESSTLMKRQGPGGGGDFKAHIFTVDSREDVIERIMSFTENGSRGVCVLSANGAVCNVQIQPLNSNRRVLMYKDAYEIISLSGTMSVTESGGVRNETGGWRITISGSDGCVFGGSIVGRLIAASPVQVVIGSFWPLIESPSTMNRNNESRSMIVTPTIPKTIMSSSFRGQVQRPETRDSSSRSLNQVWYGAGFGTNMYRPNLNK